MFLGTDGGGIWRSYDFMNASPTWSPLTDNLPLPANSKVGLLRVSSIAVDPNIPRVIYAGTDAGILKSADGGNSWSISATKSVNFQGLGGLSKIVVDPRQNNLDPNDHSSLRLYAANGTGFFKSKDGGKTWVKKPVIPDDPNGMPHPVSVSDLEYVISDYWDTITIYAGVNDQTPKNDGSKNGIYESVDEGETWTPMSINVIDYKTGKPPADIPTASVGTITIATDHTLDPQRPAGAPRKIYAAVTNEKVGPYDPGLLNIFKLASGAWSPASGDLPHSIYTYGGGNQAIGVSPSDAVYLGAARFPPAVFQSTNVGKHWEEISDGTNNNRPHPDNHAWAFFDDGAYNGNDGGIWRFRPLASTWESLNAPGLQTHLVVGVSMHPTDPNVILEGSTDNGTALLSSGIWKQVQGADTMKVRFVPNSKNNNKYAYSMKFGGDEGLYRSDNYGKEGSWNQVSLPNDEFPHHTPGEWEVDSFGSGRLLLVGSQHTFEMFDNGDNWHTVSPALSGEITNNIVAMAYANDAGVVYLAYGNGQVFKTINDGGDGTANNWTDISDGTDWDGGITGIAVSGYDSDAVYLTSKWKVWSRTLDAGKRKWIDITGNLPAVAVRNIAIVDPYLFVGTEVGVYVLIEGQCWRRFGDGLPDVPVWDLQYNSATNLLVAGTQGRGVFVAQIEPLDVPTVGITGTPHAHDCRVEALVGKTITLGVAVFGMAEPLTYQWTVSGAQPALIPLGGKKGGQWMWKPDPGDGSTFSIKFPMPGKVTVAVKVTDADGCNASSAWKGMAFTVDEAAVASGICKYSQELWTLVPFWRFIPNLPPPPPPDLMTRPFSVGDLREINRVALRMVELTNNLLKLSNAGQER